MSKRTILVLVSILGSISIWAQSPPPGVISRSPAATNIIATGTGTFTNQSGAIYSTDQLAAQLQSLRTAIEQTLPSLAAYTETVSNNATTGNKSVAGTVSQILAGALNRNVQNQSATSGQSTAQNGVTRVLQGLLGTNATSSAAVDVTTLKDLGALQNELQSAESILQRLNVSSSTNWGGVLTPTGR